MTVRKLDYAQPDCELLYVRFEENILSGKPGGNDTVIDDEEDY